MNLTKLVDAENFIVDRALWLYLSYEQTNMQECVKQAVEEGLNGKDLQEICNLFDITIPEYIDRLRKTVEKKVENKVAEDE